MNWFGEHWHWFVYAAAGALLFCLGGAVGSIARKPDVKTVEHVVYQDRVVEHTVTVAAAAKVETKRVVVYRDRVITKDGTTTEHEVETDDTTARETASATTTHDTDRTTAVDRTASKTVSSDRPQWHVGILAGGSLTSPLLPIAGPLVLGVHAERRIAGPVWAGIWALSGGSAGASVTLEF